MSAPPSAGCRQNSKDFVLIKYDYVSATLHSKVKQRDDLLF